MTAFQTIANGLEEVSDPDYLHYRITSEPPSLRHFTAKFERVAPVCGEVAQAAPNRKIY